MRADEGIWYVLGMNDMRSAQIERVRPVARARGAETLRQLVDRERVPSYVDGQWSKMFRQGGPLEWKNDPVAMNFGGVAAVFVTSGPARVPWDLVQDVLSPWEAEQIPTVEQLVAPHLGETEQLRAELATLRRETTRTLRRLVSELARLSEAAQGQRDDLAHLGGFAEAGLAVLGEDENGAPGA